MLIKGTAGLPVEVSDSVFAINAPFDDTLIYIYVIVGETVTIIDSGISSTPTDYIIPALEKLNINPLDIDLLVNTHNHHDHRGGNSAMKEYAPNLKIACHRAERRWAESTESYIQERYYRWGEAWNPSAEFEARIRRLLGKDYSVDLVLDDGDCLELSDGRSLKVWGVPEHSPGHIALWESSSRILFTGDALQADGTPFGQRKGHFPLYETVRGYRGTLALFDAADADLVATAHFGPCHGDRGTELIRESREVVDRMESYLMGLLLDSGTIDFASCLDMVERDWPRYPRTPHLVSSVRAHFDELVRQGRAEQLEAEPLRWRSVV